MAESTEVRLKLLEAFADAWNRHDVDAIMSMMTPDCIFDLSTGPQIVGQRSEGQAAVRGACAAVLTAFPDARWLNPRHTVFGDRGLSEWTFTATQKDGKRVETAGCDLFVIREGKIAVKELLSQEPAAVLNGMCDGICLLLKSGRFSGSRSPFEIHSSATAVRRS